MTRKALYKTVTWRIIAVLTAAIIAYVLLRDVLLTGVLTIVINVVHTVLYYLHEKWWERV